MVNHFNISPTGTISLAGADAVTITVWPIIDGGSVYLKKVRCYIRHQDWATRVWTDWQLTSIQKTTNWTDPNISHRGRAYFVNNSDFFIAAIHPPLCMSQLKFTYEDDLAVPAFEFIMSLCVRDDALPCTSDVYRTCDDGSTHMMKSCSPNGAYTIIEPVYACPEPVAPKANSKITALIPAEVYANVPFVFSMYVQGMAMGGTACITGASFSFSVTRNGGGYVHQGSGFCSHTATLSLPAGDYTVAGGFAGDANYNPCTFSGSFQVGSGVVTSIILEAGPGTAVYPDAVIDLTGVLGVTQGSATIPLAGYPILISAKAPNGDYIYARTVMTDSNGRFNTGDVNSVNPTIVPGVHNVMASFQGDAQYLPSQATSSWTLLFWECQSPLFATCYDDSQVMLKNCIDHHYVDMNTCPTCRGDHPSYECDGNTFWDCVNGQWVNTGIDCSQGQTCESLHPIGVCDPDMKTYWHCENGVWTDTHVACGGGGVSPYILLAGAGAAVIGLALLMRR